MTEHPNLAAALVAALADLSVVEKGRKANIPIKGGGSYSYEYADIADVVRLTRPALAEHGVVALTPVHGQGDDLGCTVVFLHASGDRLDFGPFPFPHGKDAQATGSMVTYHRRYALVAALGMAAGDDDDGAAAAPRQRETRQEPKPPATDARLVAILDRIDGLEDPVSFIAEVRADVWNGEPVALDLLPEKWWPVIEKRLDKVVGGVAPVREAGDGDGFEPGHGSPIENELVSKARAVASKAREKAEA